MEITIDNFDDKLLGIIKHNLERSCVVGFDAEFTGISSTKYRLFDTSEDRYDSLKNEVNKMIMTQVGLTMFEYDRNKETYNATSYTFHLCPQQFADIDQNFIFQASTLKFLCKHKFNFNKFIYEGIPYLNKCEEKKIRQSLKDNTIFNNIQQSLSIDNEENLQNYCSQVSKWLINSEENTMYIDERDHVLRFILHKELRTRFPVILTTDSLGESNKILLYRNKDVEGATSASDSVLEEKLMNYQLGFSKVIRLLEEYKKPIVGHNLFLDMVLLHNQFLEPLPSKYSHFKRNLNAAFPAVFDTKNISHHMKTMLTIDECWRTNGLQDLYEFFKDGKGQRLQNGANRIELVTPFHDTQTYHEAGWDSYATGYCFLRLSHWAAGAHSGRARALTPTEAVAALAHHRGHVNLIRGAVPYMNLNGEDPPPHRPNFVYLRSLNGSTINVGKVVSLLGEYGTIDVKLHGRKAALIAAGTQHTVDKILKQFKNSRDYRVALYSNYRHSFARRMAMWSSAVITGSIVIYLLHKKVVS